MNHRVISKYRSLLARARGESLKSQLLFAGVGSLTVKVGNTILSFLVAVVLARALGPANYGVYAYVFALLALLSIPAQVGLPQLVVRETAKAITFQDWPLMRGIWHWANSFVLLFSLALVTCIGGGIWLWRGLVDPILYRTLLAGLLIVPLIALSNIRGAALRGLHRVVLGQLPESIVRPCLFILLILLFILIFTIDSLSPQYAMMLHVVAAAFAFAISTWLLFRFQPKDVPAVRLPRRESSAWFRAAFPLALISGLQLINNYTDIIILGLMRTDAEVGVYRVVFLMCTLVIFGLNAVNMVLHPHFARLYTQGDQESLQRLVTTSARIILTLALPPVLLFIFAGGFLLDLIFGANYVVGATSLSILAIGQLVNAGAGSVGALLTMTGYERDTMRGMAVAAVANILLNLLLVPLYGMAGAATATAASLFIWNFILRKFVWNRLQIESLAFSLRLFLRR